MDPNLGIVLFKSVFHLPFFIYQFLFEVKKLELRMNIKMSTKRDTENAATEQKII